MKNSITISRVLCSALLLAAAAMPAAAGDTVLKFSDPGKPGRLVVQVGFGDVTIVGEDTQEVKISSDDDSQGDSQRREDGFRRLDGESGFSAGEAGNVITVTFANLFPGKHGRGHDSADVSIVVPRQTNITIERGGPGDMEVHGLSGDLEIRGAIGDIELAEMGGGVLVESVNGDVDASFTALVADKSVSITVVHGDVSLSVPADARASVQLRTLRGEMLTNFSDDQLKTRMETNDGVEDGESAGAQNAESLAKAEAERARKMAEEDRKRAERERREALKQQTADAARRNGSMPPMPPMPPMPAMPPFSSGKLVVGELNGGGTEVTVATITGDITLQKAE